MLKKLSSLREKILSGNNAHGFVERNEILFRCRELAPDLPKWEWNCFAAEQLAERLSVVVEPEDVILGRMKEGPLTVSNAELGEYYLLGSEGHITPCWNLILNRGLRGVLEDVRLGVQRQPTKERRIFLDCTERMLHAVAIFARRYAKFTDSTVLEKVPWEPATDFFSALQSVWFVQFFLSCVIGARDFALGHFDQYMLKFYQQDISSGKLKPADARVLLAHFFMKTNEIIGTATDEFNCKPTPSQCSNQYITLGGKGLFNDLSTLCVDAAELCGLKQPTLNFKLSAQAPEEVWKLAGRASQLPSIPNFFNADLIANTLMNHGIQREDAENFDFTACNRVNLPGKLYNRMERIDHFCNSTAWFVEALHCQKTPANTSELLKQLKQIAERELTVWLQGVSDNSPEPCFSIDSLFVDHCRTEACDRRTATGDHPYRWAHCMFSGLGTISDSLSAIHRLVFEQHRYSFEDYLDIVDNGFAGQETLRQEVMSRTPRFGNGHEQADAMAFQVATTLLDAADAVAQRTGFLLVCSLYSLCQHLYYGRGLGATPDGRLAGTPVSENMSPTYGADQEGPTALLHSIFRLPLQRLVCGGLNLKFSSDLPTDKAAMLLRTFIQAGGLHIGITRVRREDMIRAQQHPEAYRSLVVRKYGFSEYFISLSPDFQKELINRTEY